MVVASVGLFFGVRCLKARQAKQDSASTRDGNALGDPQIAVPPASSQDPLAQPVSQESRAIVQVDASPDQATPQEESLATEQVDTSPDDATTHGCTASLGDETPPSKKCCSSCGCLNSARSMAALLLAKGKTKGTILLQLAQVLSQFSAILGSTGNTGGSDGAFPEPAFTFASGLGVANFDFLSFVPIGCQSVDLSNFYMQLKIKVRTLTSVCSFCVDSRITPLWCLRVCFVVNHLLSHPVLRETLAPLLLVGLLWIYPLFLRLSGKFHLRAQSITADFSLMGLELLLPSTSTAIFQTLVCSTFDDGLYLRAQLTLPCNHSGYRRSYLLFAWLNVLVYPIGIPLLHFAVLFPRREKIKKMVLYQSEANIQVTSLNAHRVSKQHRPSIAALMEDLSWLTRRFRKFHGHCWWMGVFLMVTRVLQTGLIALFPKQSIQASVVSALVLLDICIIRELVPYSLESDNHVAVLAKGAIFFWAFAFLINAAGALEGVPTVVIGIALVSTMVGVIVRALVLTRKDILAAQGAEAEAGQEGAIEKTDPATTKQKENDAPVDDNETAPDRAHSQHAAQAGTARFELRPEESDTALQRHENSQDAKLEQRVSSGIWPDFFCSDDPGVNEKVAGEHGNVDRA